MAVSFSMETKAHCVVALRAGRDPRAGSAHVKSSSDETISPPPLIVNAEEREGKDNRGLRPNSDTILPFLAVAKMQRVSFNIRA
jgi:hypothetical protein